MPRPQRKEINFSKDSILSLMQEIYNELVEQRQTAIRIQNKMLSMLKDAEDMTTIGPVIEKQQKIVNECVEKKISLSKYVRATGTWFFRAMSEAHLLNLILFYHFHTWGPERCTLMNLFNRVVFLSNAQMEIGKS